MGGISVEAGAGFDISTAFKSLGDKLDNIGRRDPRPIMRTIPSSAVQTNAAGGPVYVSMGGPASGKIWYIRQLVATLGDAFSNQGIATVNGGAASTQTLTLPAGAVLTGLEITSAGAAAAPVTGAVTIAGSGATQTIQYVFTANGTVLNQGLDLMPTTPNTPIVITMPAVAGGTAFSMTATYDFPVAWYVSFANAGDLQPVSVGISELLVPGVGTLPQAILPGDSDGLYVHFGEHVIAQINGLPIGQSVMALVRVSEVIDSATEARRM